MAPCCTLDWNVSLHSNIHARSKHDSGRDDVVAICIDSDARQFNSAYSYDSRGQYSGLRWSTIFVLVVAVAPNLPGFINAAFKTDYFPEFFNQLYSYAWFVGITIAFVLYGVLNIGERYSADPSRV